ncbi:hypothetical protein [Actinophytocola sediminis]
MTDDPNSDLNGDPNDDLNDADVRRWLDGALAGEPPLSLDRAGIVRDGKRGLRNRRLFQTGGAVAGVVAVVLGTVLVSSLVTENPTIPPAAGEPPTGPVRTPTPSAPDSTKTTVSPPSSTSADESADRTVARLAAVLSEPGVLPTGADLQPLLGASGPEFYEVETGVYQLEADLYTSDGSGQLWLTVERGAAGSADCTDIIDSVTRCEVREEYGHPMAIGQQEFADGQLRRVVRAVRPEGGYVTVTTSNITSIDEYKGRRPQSKATSLSESTMIKLAVQPDLVVR